jgi:hypothetical protein
MTQALGFTHWKSTALKKVSGWPGLGFERRNRCGSDEPGKINEIQDSKDFNDLVSDRILVKYESHTHADHYHHGWKAKANTQ